MVSGISGQQMQIGGLSAQKNLLSQNTGSSQMGKSIGNCMPCSGCGQCGNPQDPSTVTQEQLQSPIDLKV